MSKIHIVHGPPGCGKTYHLAQRAAQAAAQYGHDKIIVTSLTRAGARQAARQVDLPDSQVGTLHSIIYHAVGAPEIAEGHIKEWNEAYPHFEFKHHSETIDDPYGTQGDLGGDELKMELSRMRTKQVPRESWPSNILKDFADDWQDWKNNCGYVDFIDLLEMGFELETAPGEPAAILLDEAQDFGSLEMSLLLRWSKYTEHFVACGDAHQSLYSFRGSDPHLLYTLNAEWRTLDTSYRIPYAVHQQAIRWMERTGLPMVDYKPRDESICVACHTRLRARDGGRWDVECSKCGRVSQRLGTLRRDSTSYRDAERVVRLLYEYLEMGKTVMLMATCQYMLDPVCSALRKAGIGYHNPWRPNSGRWNPLAPRKGATIKDKVLTFLQPDDDIWGEKAHFWTAKELQTWVKALPSKGILQRSAKAQIERLPNYVPDTELSERMRGWFTPEALERVHGLDVDWYLDHAQGGAISKDFVKNIIKHYGIQELQKEPRTIVGTAHSLKGSEADVVFVWPDISPKAYFSGSSESREEIARVFYVAVTRAREELVLMGSDSDFRVGW